MKRGRLEADYESMLNACNDEDVFGSAGHAEVLSNTRHDKANQSG